MRITLLFSALLLAGPAAAQDIEALKLDTREKALPVLPKVVKMMQDTVADKGVAGAIPVCKDKAPALLKARAEELGWKMRRVSLKTRNPERGTPDAWETAQLTAFDLRAAAGEPASALEVGEVMTQADGTKMFRYMRAIPVGDVCLSCHGDPANIAPDLKAELDKSYPQDHATGYAKGQIRGALTIERPL
ncbi:MAG TPA: DUF3365 domain-containing protein [Denitromonas sp.]|uniref:Tll0287-like domain-containing protein n=1 Tax=Denitromonas sp. TaxID=2734609 RepID=UPI002B78A17D|nr:DUF3365 domain-containing protein [Denitromonas sp.]HQU90378.1 DUF3365 domain-containing protein [Denitromonas sp.]HQV16533.1 DUF3365 domain-containing protein [Denitromonas sp.]